MCIRHTGFGGRLQRAVLAQGEDVVDHAGASGHGRARITSGLKVSMLIGTRAQPTARSPESPDAALPRSRPARRPGGWIRRRYQAGPHLLDQLQSMRDRSLGGVVRATIGERIGGDVDDAHDPARSRRRMRPAQSSWGEVSNMGNPAGATRRSLSRGGPRMRAVVPAPIAAWPQALRRARPGSDIRWGCPRHRSGHGHPRVTTASSEIAEARCPSAPPTSRQGLRQWR